MNLSRFLLLILMFMISLGTSTIWGEEGLKESPEEKQARLLEEEAHGYYLESLETCDDKDIWKSVEKLEEIIERYPDSIAATNEYFTIAELLASKIQTEDAFNGAVKAYEDYITRFPWGDKAWEAQYNIAAVQYLYLKDYKSAKASIEKLFEDYEIALKSNDDDMKKVKLLYSKIMHKSGELGKELEALQEVEFLDPSISFSYHIELIRNIKPNRIMNDEDDRFIFMGKFDPNFPVKRLIYKFREAEEEIQKRLPKLKRKFPLEIFVYQDDEYFEKTTNRTGSFASGPDAQVFYIDGQPIEPLFAQIYAFLINNQPSDLRVNFLEVGFINSFSDMPLKLDHAALNLGLSEEEFEAEKLFDNNEFAFVSERDIVGAAFVDFLLTKYPVENFYRAFRLLEGVLETEIILKGFKSVYGLDFQSVRSEFLLSMTARRAELDRLLDMYWATNPPDKLKIDQSSARGVLVSYFGALRAGDYEAFMNLTTGDLHETLKEAHKIYKEKKILDKVERWKMAIPYMNYRLDVTAEETVAGTIVAFAVSLLRDDVVMERKSLLAVEKDGKWYIAQN